MPAVLLLLVEYAIHACLNRILPVSLSSLSCASIMAAAGPSNHVHQSNICEPAGISLWLITR